VLQLDLSSNELSLAHNNLEDEGTKAICEALEQNTTLKELDMSGGCNIGGAAGAKHVAKMLGVYGGLTKLSLAQNKLKEEGTKAICEALEQNTTLKELDISGRYEGNIGGSAGAKHVAKMLGVNGALTSVDLRGNQLRDEGWGAIFAAICGNKDSKIIAMDASSENISPAGVKLIAEALRTSVTGALTQVLAFCAPPHLNNLFQSNLCLCFEYCSWTSPTTCCAASILMAMELTPQRASQRLPTLCASMAG